MARVKEPVLVASFVAAALAACGGSSRPATAPAASAALEVTVVGVGPIKADTPATVEALRALLPGHDVEVAGTPGLGAELGPPALRVSSGGEALLLVVPDEKSDVLMVLVTSAQVGSQAGWRVGETLADVTPIAGCECRADGLTCYGKDLHVGAVLDDDCMKKLEDDAMAGRRDAATTYGQMAAGDAAALATLKGRAIRMLLWQPRAFGTPSASDPPPPVE